MGDQWIFFDKLFRHFFCGNSQGAHGRDLSGVRRPFVPKQGFSIQPRKVPGAIRLIPEPTTMRHMYSNISFFNSETAWSTALAVKAVKKRFCVLVETMAVPSLQIHSGRGETDCIYSAKF
jgi:hypothetical protein